MPLFQLRCVKRCYLGSVIQTDEGTRLVMDAHVIVHDHHERQKTGPYPIDGTEFVDFGCKHSAGEVLDEHHWAEIAERATAVRNGDTPPGGVLIVVNHHGGPVA